MIDRDGRPMSSDVMSIQYRNVSSDIGCESGIGSDSESINGVDPTLTPSTLSPRPSYSDNDPPLSLHTSGHMTELLSSDKPDWLHVAEQYASDLPHDILNVSLEEEFARLVLQPPPMSTSEVICVDSRHVARRTRRLPSLPSNEARFDELPYHSTQKQRDDSSELWRRAASVGHRDRLNVIAHTVNHSAQSNASSDQTGSRKDTTHATVVPTSAAQGQHDNSLSTELSPGSRDRRQPISDVAPASGCPIDDNGDEQRVEVVQPAHNTSVTESQSAMTCDGMKTVQSPRQVSRRLDWTSDHVTHQQRPHTVLKSPNSGDVKSSPQQQDDQHYPSHHHHHHQQQQQQHADFTALSTDEITNDIDLCQPIQPSVDVQPGSPTQHGKQQVDRKSTENGTDDRKWRSQVNRPMSFYLTGDSRQPAAVTRPEVTSDRKQTDRVTSPECGRKQHGLEGDNVDPALGSLEKLAYYNSHEERSHDRGLTTNKLLERRRRADSRGRMTAEQNLRLMVDQLNTRQRQLHHNRPPADQTHVDSQRQTTRRATVDDVHTPSSLQSPRSQPHSPFTPHDDQHVSPAWTPVQHHNISPRTPPAQRIDPATRRQMEYEAGLRRYGPNYQPQHWTTDDNDDDRQQASMYNDVLHVDNQSPASNWQHHQVPTRPRTSASSTSLDMYNMTEETPRSSRDRHGGKGRRQSSTPDMESSRRSTHSTWHSVQTLWQSSLPRLFHSKVDKNAPSTAHHTSQSSQPSNDRLHALRSSSTVPFTESAIDVEFHSTTVPLHRPVPRRPTNSAVPASHDFNSQLSRRLAADPCSSPSRNLARKFGNIMLRRKSQSENSSREQSPVRAASPSKDCKTTRKDSKDVNDRKTKPARMKSPFRKTREAQTVTTVSDNDNHHFTSSLSSSAAATGPVKCEVPSVPATAGHPRFDHQSSTDESSGGSPSKPANNQDGSGTPSTPLDRDVSTDIDNARRQGKYVKNNHKNQGRAHLKLPTPPSVDTQVPDSPAKSNPSSRPQQLQVQFSITEKDVINKHYDGPSAVEDAVGDINQLMTSLQPVTTPTSGSDVISASDSDLVSSPGSKTSSLDSVDKVDMTDGGHSRSVGEVGVSFRRSELVPTVRRFTLTCHQLSSTISNSDRAHQFHAQLTESLHAFVAVLAVSRRATYGQQLCSQINDGLRQVGQSYIEMLSAAGPAVSLTSDDPAVIEASKKATKLGQQLSSLLIIVKHLKPTRTDPHNTVLI